jgi:hypothetical protein
MRARSCLFIGFLSLFTLALASGCNGPTQPAAEQPPTAYQSPAQATPLKPETVAALTVTDVEQVVKRIFKDAAVIHPEYKNSFLTGDFNGDLSQDLAVVLKPAPEKLAELNEEYPRWLLRDPRAPHDPRTRLRVEKDEALLAVIHGYGPKAWRDPEATQTFLLKNVAGTDMRVHNGTEFIKTNSNQKAPRANGDLISEKLKGSEGYLYFNAATYSWYDPKTLKGENEIAAGVFHGRNAPRR